VKLSATVRVPSKSKATIGRGTALSGEDEAIGAQNPGGNEVGGGRRAAGLVPFRASHI
jgi:hypothetical protein